MFPRTATACFVLYRTVLSPLLHTFAPVPGGCRFTPSCSAYGASAIRQYGLGIGFVFLLKRLLRCRPGGGFGYDPVSPHVRSMSRADD